MKRRTLLKGMAAALPSLWMSRAFGHSLFEQQLLKEPLVKGPFKPTWDSLQMYQTPEWYRNAKFGMWAHWGPQCQPEAGDCMPAACTRKDRGSTSTTWKNAGRKPAKAMVWDIERGQTDRIEPLPWQTDTCIGGWHYDRGLYNRKGYKSAKTVVHTLVDVVSKNGNLLLNVPVRGDGSIDELERKVVEDIGRWSHANGESIFGTRPWKVFGEGPAQEAAAALTAQGFNEGKGKPFSAEDIRFVTKGDILYATVMGWPDNRRVVIKSLATGSAHYPKEIFKVEWPAGKAALSFERNSDGLVVSFPEQQPADGYANVLKIG